MPTLQGGTKTVGEWALHIQTPWNIVRKSRILVGSHDLSQYVETDPAFVTSGPNFDWSIDGKSQFDRHASTLNQEFEISPPTVNSIVCDCVGTFTLLLENDLTFSAFPDCSSSSLDFELWRLFQPATEHAHYVVSADTSAAEDC